MPRHRIHLSHYNSSGMFHHMIQGQYRTFQSEVAFLLRTGTPYLPAGPGAGFNPFHIFTSIIASLFCCIIIRGIISYLHGARHLNHPVIIPIATYIGRSMRNNISCICSGNTSCIGIHTIRYVTGYRISIPVSTVISAIWSNQFGHPHNTGIVIGCIPEWSRSNFRIPGM